MKSRILALLVMGVFTLAVLSVISAVFAGIDRTRAQAVSDFSCLSGRANIAAVDGRLDFVCDTPMPNPPTDTPTPVVPTDTPTPGAPIEPFAEAPLCPVELHNDREKHGLWNDAGCHYDHTHGADPDELNDKFGTALFEMMGGKISYPWGTPNENGEVKHKAFVWLTGEDIPCASDFTNGCITDYRVSVHNDIYNVFSTHHSALVEARICDENNPGRCGYMLIAGHQATGDLRIDNQIVLDRQEPPYGPRPVLLHYDQTGQRGCATWYPALVGWMRVSTEVCDMFGYYPIPAPPLPITDTTKLVFTPLNGDSSNVQLHVLGLGVPARFVSLVDPDGNGLANYDGFINVMTGEPGGDCVEIGEICAPLILRDVPLGTGGFQYRGEYTEFDIFFNGESSGWIQFPGFDPPRP